MTTDITPNRFIPRWLPDLFLPRRLDPRQSGPGGNRFATFISYKHVSSTGFAMRLERALKGYAKPLLARPRRIFRDEKHIAPGIDLPRLIEEALEDSEFLLLLASPESARSPWVQDELDLWCRVLKRQERLVVILLDGDIEVDSESKQIDWSGTDALPTFMAEHLATVPLYLDLRKLARLEDIGLNDPDFKRAINGIVARFRGIDPNEMLGEENRQYRRNLRLRNGAIAALVMLTMLSGGFWFLADSARREAEGQRQVAEEQKQVADSAKNEALEKTREAERSLANNYWASGISAEEKNNPVAAAHFFARATQKYSDKTAIKTGRLKLRTVQTHSAITLDALLDIGDAQIIEVSADGSRILTWSKQTWTPIPNQPGWEQCEFEHECSGWGKPREFVAVRVEKEQKPSEQQELFQTTVWGDDSYICTETSTSPTFRDTSIPTSFG
uniref:TIR domain-containing protein n=1 Tax=Candidatus Kentrum eta TaxID=2126337 RepID=A0A450U6J1_9GAMM|nr:MAG: TIR domain-containing protein [Candidatus Kentron sp. H]VFJ88899.1 MAG: TIR domain-containing protein [Candidatus Kentron sp. H]VFJ95135.1 MAG: TIR domain-containing protein [Candidatus Kentron sp. H]